MQAIRRRRMKKTIGILGEAAKVFALLMLGTIGFFVAIGGFAYLLGAAMRMLADVVIEYGPYIGILSGLAVFSFLLTSFLVVAYLLHKHA
jgi:hypothetical protein